MGFACRKCGNEDLTIDPLSCFRLGIPHLNELQQATVVLTCRSCRTSVQCVIKGKNRPGFSHFMDVLNGGQPDPSGLQRGHISLRPHPGPARTFVNFRFAHRPGEGVLWPVHEATIQDGTVIDRYGNSDLMADFAKEYLTQHLVLLQPGRLPKTLVGIMPSLLLLVTSAELALKAFLLRSEGKQPHTHDLVDLYGRLNPEHQAAIKSQFSTSQPVAVLASLGVDIPQIDHLLRIYADIYGNKRGTYQEAKFYAEPTSMLPRASSLRDANLVKGNTPYPTFMPYLVQAIIDCYYYFSGLARLRRRGAQIHKRTSGSASHNHGDWALRPSSLNLATIVVSQQESKDDNLNNLPAFKDFKSRYPTGFKVDWMHGGSTLLFYDATEAQLRDGIETNGGVEYRVICDETVGMHARDLDRLADALEAVDDGGTLLGTLTQKP